MPARKPDRPLYRPAPIDTTRVALPPELDALLERLSRHNHDVWALQRLSEGWIWGHERRDDDREHPGLVPYEQLSKSEQEYDRRTTEQLLKAILALGWELRQGLSAAERIAPAVTESAAAVSAEAQRLLGAGSPLAAYDSVCEALERWPRDLRLRQLEALALARSGATERAAERLLTLYREGHLDGETVGLLAGRHKELAALARGNQERLALLRSAQRFYELAYRWALERAVPVEACFNGINLATLSLFAGDGAQAAEVARRVRRLCEEAAASPDADAYWLEATRAEAALVLGEWSDAEAHYERAAAHAQQRWAEIASTRRQALAILRHVGRSPDVVQRTLHIPGVATFSVGSDDAAAALADLRERLERREIGFGYASADSVAETVFHETLLEAGAETHLVLPAPPERFRDARVATGAGTAWAERFDRLCARAASIHAAGPGGGAESAASAEYAGLLRDGLAALRARFLDTTFVSLTDGRKPSAPACDAPPHTRPRVMGLLFADAVGFSALTDAQIPAFVEHFLGAAARLLEGSAAAPVLRNTWGDGLYFVFDSVGGAAAFALDLRDAIEAGDWGSVGLPASLSLRIALHAGPVIPVFDPVTRTPGFAGAHVSRAARIEPITPPGQVYASEAFAALATAMGAPGIAFEYVGRTRLAKNYGSQPLYHLRRAST